MSFRSPARSVQVASTQANLLSVTGISVPYSTVLNTAGVNGVIITLDAQLATTIPWLVSSSSVSSPGAVATSWVSSYYARGALQVDWGFVDGAGVFTAVSGQSYPWRVSSDQALRGKANYYNLAVQAPAVRLTLSVTTTTSYPITYTMAASGITQTGMNITQLGGFHTPTSLANPYSYLGAVQSWTAGQVFYPTPVFLPWVPGPTYTLSGVRALMNGSAYTSAYVSAYSGATGAQATISTSGMDKNTLPSTPADTALFIVSPTSAAGAAGTIQASYTLYS